MKLVQIVSIFIFSFSGYCDKCQTNVFGKFAKYNQFGLNFNGISTLDTLLGIII